MAKLIDELLTEIDQFLSDTGMTPTVFGREVARNPSLVFRLREGRSCKAETVDRVRAYLAKHREKAA